jgi:hypothetical protein
VIARLRLPVLTALAIAAICSIAIPGAGASGRPSHAADASSYDYDSSPATTTPPTNTRIVAFVVERRSEGGPGSSTVSIGLSSAARGATSRFGALTHSSRGIKSYSEQAAVTAGQRGQVQAHHLIEKRFARQIGGDTDEWASIVATRAEHQAFTNAWRREIP